MKFLSIETSTKYSVVCIGDEKKMRFGERRLYEKGRLDGISVLIEDALKKSKTRLGDIGAFGVGTGPGSFTGVRIGVSTVKGLAYALKKPCYGFSSLDAIACTSCDESFENLCVMVDARRSNVYVRFYKKRAGLKAVSGAELLSIDQLWPRCSAGMHFSGDGVGIYRDMIKKRVEGAVLLEEPFWFVRPEGIWRLTAEGIGRKNSKTPSALAATYLYEQDCQIKKAC